jgi:hypothetical protein
MNSADWAYMAEIFIATSSIHTPIGIRKTF